jgi:NAD(P)-dependent dehydrogenase (short-subunit alcohol dehydrogenase family)
MNNIIEIPSAGIFVYHLKVYNRTRAYKRAINMKHVIITGSTRGIGWAMAKEFLQRGHRVTISGRHSKLSPITESELTGHSDAYAYFPCDVKNKEEIQKLWDFSVESWGKIDIWINNAGVNSPHEAAYNIEKNYTDDVVNTNILGVIYGSQVAAKEMLNQGSGAIYNMEGLGSNNMIQRNTVLYGTSKHALTYFTRGLAKELKGTPVIAGRLSPGMMLTDFITKTPDGRKAAIEEDTSFQKIFNVLADKPETVAQFLIEKMLNNTKNDAQFVWLTYGKVLVRFVSSLFRSRKII